MLSARRAAAGFTMVELLITFTLLSVLLAVAVPSFSAWVQNARMRTVAEALQNGVRLAQAESVRRNRQVVLMLTNAEPGLAATAAANGSNWALFTVPMDGETREFIKGGSFSDVAAGVTITGPAAVCFNSMGRVVANPDPDLPGGTACTIAAGTTVQTYEVRRTGADRRLDVRVSLGGQVRMCDPDVALSASPGGCA